MKKLLLFAAAISFGAVNLNAMDSGENQFIGENTAMLRNKLGDSIKTLQRQWRKVYKCMKDGDCTDGEIKSFTNTLKRSAKIVGGLAIATTGATLGAGAYGYKYPQGRIGSRTEPQRKSIHGEFQRMTDPEKRADSIYGMTYGTKKSPYIGTKDQFKQGAGVIPKSGKTPWETKFGWKTKTK